MSFFTLLRFFRFLVEPENFGKKSKKDDFPRVKFFLETEEGGNLSLKSFKQHFKFRALERIS